MNTPAPQKITPPEFTRELRYVVVKIKDANAYLTSDEKAQLERLAAKCGLGRIDNGKRNLECVVIESDWPEYEPTWAAIEARMTGTSRPTHSAQEAAERAARDVIRELVSHFGDECDPRWSRAYEIINANNK